MDKSTKYLNNVSIPDLESDTDNVSYNEAIVACEIMRLETLKQVVEYKDMIEEFCYSEIEKLEKKLRNIKY